jgi:hypothetical protein
MTAPERPLRSCCQTSYRFSWTSHPNFKGTKRDFTRNACGANIEWQSELGWIEPIVGIQEYSGSTQPGPRSQMRLEGEPIPPPATIAAFIEVA